MSYPNFTPTKENYLKYCNKKVQLKKRVVTVHHHKTESRGGSWARGFRFYESTWALLSRVVRKSKHYIPTQWSFDHGKTWHTDKREAWKNTKGKLRLTSSNHGELAFEGIQRIVRDWEGPSYRWTR